MTLRWMCYRNFYEDMGERPDGTTLDRIDVNKGYFKENCRWADSATQARNRRSTRLLTIDGVTKCVTDWERDNGLPACLVKQRLGLGWPVERLLDPPRHTNRRASLLITSLGDTAAPAEQRR
jgi:hypothetical protein